MSQNVVLETLLFKRGLEQNRSQLIPKLGEPIFVTDTKEFYIGDGVTQGGVPIGALRASTPVNDGELAVFDGNTGKYLKTITKAALLTDYVTSAALETRLTAQLQVQVDSAKEADDALKLNGRADYVTEDAKTNSYQEDDVTKVASAKAVNDLYVYTNTQLASRDVTLASKVDKTSVVNSVSSTSTTAPASANAVKQAYDLANGAQQLIASVQTTAQTALNTSTAAQAAAQQARSAPDLADDRKRPITISASPATGTPDEGTIWIQV